MTRDILKTLTDFFPLRFFAFWKKEFMERDFAFARHETYFNRICCPLVKECCGS